LFAVATGIITIHTKWGIADAHRIPTRIAIAGTTIAIGAMAGTIRTHTTATGGTDVVTGHIATEECKSFNRIKI